MKKFTLSGLLIVLLSLCSLAAHAYDLKKTNISTCYYNKLYDSDGKYIYDSNSHRTMELTYENTNYNTYSGTIHVHQYASDDLINYYYCIGIGDRACYNCSGLTGVTLNSGVPSQLTYIGKEAFANCTSLTDLDLSSTNITAIGNQAFANCTSISSLGLSGLALESLGDSAFYNCTSITKIDLSNSKLTSIPDYAFYGCTSLKEVDLPSTITSIGSFAFASCSALESINIPSSVTTIKNNAFGGCFALTTVSLPSSLTTLGEQAFYNCQKLGTINLGDTQITSIGTSTFTYCYALTSIIIPSSVTSIGGSAFYYCSSLEEVEGFENTQITSIGTYAFYYCSKLTTVNGFGNTQITSIPADLFEYCGALDSITIPSGVTSIGARAFEYCTALQSITIPENVTNIYAFAFGNCTNLRDLVFKATNCTAAQSWSVSSTFPSFYNCPALENVTIVEGVTTIPAGFLNGQYSNYFPNLTSIDIPSSVTTIGNYAFAYCESLSTVEGMGDTDLTTIGYFAFCHCSAVTTINIPSSVSSIGIDAFANCSSLTALNGLSSATSLTAIPDYFIAGCSSLSTLTLPTTITSVGVHAFQNCTNLTSVNNFGDLNITSIPTYLFYNDTSLQTITIPSSVTSFGTYVFYGCTSLETVEGFGDLSITSIPDYLFYQCSALKSITIPSGVEKIGDYAFYQCSALKSITIPSGVEKIGDYAFYYCTSLDSLLQEEESQLTTIGTHAFYKCGFKSFEIPSGVTSIGDAAFGYCSKLTDIAYNAVNCTYAGTKNYPPFNNNDNSLETVTIGEGVETIPDYLFYYCQSSTITITPPSSLTSIGKYAFAYCQKLTSFEIPSGVTSIGECAFRNCTKLTDVVFNATECTDGGGTSDYPTFCDCSALTNVTIGEGVTTIPKFLFDGRNSNNFPNFTSINIPSSVTTIGISAFYDCTSLTSIYSYAASPPTCKGENYLIGQSFFGNVPSTCVLYVPAGSEEAYGDYYIDGYYIKNAWNSLSTVRTFHLLDVKAKAADGLKLKGSDEDDYGYMTYYNGEYTYTLPAGMKASAVTGIDDTHLTTQWEYDGDDPDKAVVPAYTAVVLYGKLDEFMAMVDYDGSDTSKYGTIASEGTSVDSNWLHGVWDTSDLYTGGDYTSVVFGYDDNGSKTTDGFLFYTLNYDGIDDETGVYKDIGFYWGEDEGKPFTIAAKKAWLAVPCDSSDDTKFSAFTFGADGETTGIEAVSFGSPFDDDETIGEGSGDGYIYNLAGQRVNDTNRRGVYIVNGRKVVKK